MTSERLESKHYTIFRNSILTTEESLTTASGVVEFSEIHDGFRDDCDDLIRDFLKSNDIRINKFASIWKSMRFEKVLSGRPTYYEYRETVEMCFEVIGSYIFSPHEDEQDDLSIRIAGLYLAYSLYHSCWFKNIAFIRVTPKSLIRLTETRNRCVSGGHSDVLYVIRYLLFHGVFKFVSTTRDYLYNAFVKTTVNPEMGNDMPEVMIDIKVPNLKEELESKKELLEGLSKQMKKYTNIKQKRISMAQASGAKIPKLMHFNLNLSSEILQSLDGMKHKVTQKPKNKFSVTFTGGAGTEGPTTKERKNISEVPFFLEESFSKNNAIQRLYESVSMCSFMDELKNEESLHHPKVIQKKQDRRFKKVSVEDLL